MGKERKKFMDSGLQKQMNDEAFSRNEIYKLNLKNSEMREKVNFLKEENAALEDEITALEDEITALNQVRSGLEDTVKNLKNEEKCLRELLENCHMRNEALENTVKELRNSTSYRLGWFLTTIPRKIKDFIKGQKYQE